MKEKSSVFRPLLAGEAEKPSPRIVVLGSSGHAHVTCVDWDVDPFPNLVDYDICVVNVRSLTDKIISTTKNERFKYLRRLLTRLIVSNGKIIVLSDFLREVKKPKSYPESNDNYDWAPIPFRMTKESGDTKEIVKDRFPKYFSKLKQWHYFVRSTSYSDEFTEYCGSGNEFAYEPLIDVLIRNREGRVISAAVSVKRLRKSDGKADVFGEVIFLPLLTDVGEREAVSLLLEDVTGLPQVTLPPPWTNEVPIPAATSIQTKLDTARQAIQHWTDEAEKLAREKAQYDEFKKLLYASGPELEEIFKNCLERLGCTVVPAKHGKEEYIAQYQGEEHLVEAKGVSKSASLEHLRQLLDYLLIYDQETGKECHGVLFVNAWRSTPPTERGTAQQPIFPSDVVKRAAANNIALISSVDFFHAFCKFLDNPKVGSTILARMMSGKGITDLNVA